MPLYFFYTIVQKSQKWPKTQIKGSCQMAWFLVRCVTRSWTSFGETEKKSVSPLNSMKRDMKGRRNNFQLAWSALTHPKVCSSQGSTYVDQATNAQPKLWLWNAGKRDPTKIIITRAPVAVEPRRSPNTNVGTETTSDTTIASRVSISKKSKHLWGQRSVDTIKLAYIFHYIDLHAQRHRFRAKRNHFRGQSSRWR